MRYFTGMVVAAGLWLGMADESQAQFSLSIGSPYGYGYPAYGAYGGGGYYGSGYLGAPGAFAYSSGYQGIAPVVPYAYGGYGYGGYGYGVRNYGYGVRNYGYGVRGGYGPFRGGRRFYR